MKWGNSFVYMFLMMLLNACVSEDYFGYSPYGNIKTFEITNQASLAIINNTAKTVHVEIPPGVDLSALSIKNITLSSFASSDKTIGSSLNLNNDEVINVTAENGSVVVWIVKASTASSTPQIEHSDFNTWYQTDGGFYEPGADAATTAWGTGNAGTQILNILATTPLELSDNNLAVRMETMDNGPVAGAFGTPISAGSVFTGKFDKDKIDPSNPQAAIEFGTPFTGRPKKIKLKYQYSPGIENKDKDGNILPQGDKCDIYLLLEVRSVDKVERLATAWYRNGDEQVELNEIELDLIYGPLDDTYPDYMKPDNGLFVNPETSKFILPSHLTFVASSSFDGANFAGAIGSTLIVDDVVMVYE